MRELEAVLKAAGDPTRTRILKLLEAAELCVCQVQAVLGLAPSTVSKHLAILRSAGLVNDRREGRWIRYALARGTRNPYARGLLGLLCGPLDEDPRIVADRRRLREVRAIPLERLCGAPVPARAGLPRGAPKRAILRRAAAPRGRPRRA